MQYQVEANSETIVLESKQVVDILLRDILPKQDAESEAFVTEICSYFSEMQMYPEMQLRQLIYISFRLGSKYQIFKDKNKVNIINADRNTDSDSNDQESN